MEVIFKNLLWFFPGFLSYGSRENICHYRYSVYHLFLFIHKRLKFQFQDCVNCCLSFCFGVSIRHGRGCYHNHCCLAFLGYFSRPFCQLQPASWKAPSFFGARCRKYWLPWTPNSRRSPSSWGHSSCGIRCNWSEISSISSASTSVCRGRNCISRRALRTRESDQGRRSHGQAHPPAVCFFQRPRVFCHSFILLII